MLFIQYKDSKQAQIAQYFASLRMIEKKYSNNLYSCYMVPQGHYYIPQK